MTTSNLYATLAEFKSWGTARGQTASTDATDDAVIESLLEGVSRYIDDQVASGRTFYPRWEKRYYDVPVFQNSPRNLSLDDDLLQEVTITNGDGTVIANGSITYYNLKPKNVSPHYAIQIVGPSNIFWIFNAIGSIEKVISVEGWWGFHNRYDQRAWTAVGTLGAAITDTTTLAFTMSAGHSVLANNILKIDNEIYNVATGGVSTNTITPNQRGDNGSTAATHTNGTTVYRWNVQPEIKEAALMTALNIYDQRSGQSGGGGKVTVTAAGVVIRPDDVPSWAQKTINSFRKTA